MTKEWYARNKEKVNAAQRARYAANREANITKAREYREKNREIILLRKKLKYANDPAERQRIRDYKKNNYARLKPRIFEYMTEYRATKIRDRKRKIRRYIWDYLLSHPCTDCGETNPIVLEFDHVRGEKKFAIAEALGYALPTVQAEMAKCEVRCANCHRIKSFRDAGHHVHLTPEQVHGIAKHLGIQSTCVN